ncbi:MAG: hypothetical protein ACYDGM_12330, partial [Vulcanimicrobiaceae bacterium]
VVHSYKKHPFTNFTTSSNTRYFRFARRRERHAAKVALTVGSEPMADRRLFSDPFYSPGDGRHYWGNDAPARILRK